MKFIVFEGLDGSGKSSLIRGLQERMTAEKISFQSTREPGGTLLAEKIRSLIVDHSEEAPVARTELLLYEAARSQHVEKVIRPSLQKGQWVLCDRFTASSIAFQAGGRGIELQDVKMLNHFATSGLQPDQIILLDLSVEESERRRLRRQAQEGSSADRIESEARSFHEKVRQGFLDQVKEDPTRWLVLDAENTTQQMVEVVWTSWKDRGWLDCSSNL